MGVICRPRFGRPCFECCEIVPKQRLDELGARAAMNGRDLVASDRLCVRCETKRNGEVTVTRRPRC